VFITGAGHLIEPIYTPCVLETYHVLFKTIIAMGGTLDLHAQGQEIAWKRLLQFLQATKCPTEYFYPKL